jgi:hypothetical protein
MQGNHFALLLSEFERCFLADKSLSSVTTVKIWVETFESQSSPN